MIAGSNEISGVASRRRGRPQGDACCAGWEHVQVKQDFYLGFTLWLFNLAMENGP